MRRRARSVIALAAALLWVGGSRAIAPEDQIARLGADLTPVGAERAGNAAGSIPEWTGGITKPPPGWKRGGPRIDPFLRRAAMHSGIDFKAPYGQAVLAAAPGKVTKAERNGGYGRMIEIDHGDGFTTRYAHLSRYAVKVGTKVSGGQVIGSVGNSGRSTGTHLHYEARVNDTPVNPYKFVKAGRELSWALD